MVRDGRGQFCVLEDNLRVPSGVPHMLENRKMMARLFPELFARHPIEPVEHYPDILLENLKKASGRPASTDPTVVLLTPGAQATARTSSTHSWLSKRASSSSMGCGPVRAG